MKTIEKKHGAKTVIKIVEDDYQPTVDWQPKDITTSLRKSLSFGDIPSDRWNKIFKEKKDE